jgi:Zn-dependent protease with chaperone function
MKTKVPPFILRVSFLLALTGGFIGVLIGWNNGDDLGWSLLRGAILFLAFGIIARWWLKSMAKAWLESRLESFQPKSKATESRPPLGRTTN